MRGHGHVGDEISPRKLYRASALVRVSQTSVFYKYKKFQDKIAPGTFLNQRTHHMMAMVE